MKVEIELPEIEGFEYTGAFMLPLSGEYFVYDAEGHSVVFAEEDQGEKFLNAGTKAMQLASDGSSIPLVTMAKRLNKVLKTAKGDDKD